jgi:hypothetical protein
MKILTFVKFQITLGKRSINEVCLKHFLKLIIYTLNKKKEIVTKVYIEVVNCFSKF